MYGEVMFEKGNMFSLREGDFQVSCRKDLRLLLYQTCDFKKKEMFDKGHAIK